MALSKMLGEEKALEKTVSFDFSCPSSSSQRDSIDYPYYPPAPVRSVPMDNLDFLKLSSGNATLTIHLPDDITVTLSDLDPATIAEYCPILAISFETGESGRPQGSIEVPSLLVGICFLRFCYTGSYMPNWDTIEENSNCSLLVHAQLCHLGEIFDIAALQAAAHLNVMRETELSCSRPNAPPDLCDTIRYIFTRLSSQGSLIDTVINYCVNCFSYHHLGANPEFRQMAYELQDFTRELSKVNMHRDFLDDGAHEIIQLPCMPTEHSEARFARKVLGDFVYEIFSSDATANLFTPSSTPHLRPQLDRDLPMRPRADYFLVPKPAPNNVFDDPFSSSDEETPSGFTLVHRPRDTSKTYVEADSGQRYNTYDDSDTETLTGRESPVLVPTEPTTAIKQEPELQGESSSKARLKSPEMNESSQVDWNSDCEWDLL